MSNEEPACEPTPEVTMARIAELTERFRMNAKSRLAQNAVTQSPADDVALNREIVTEADFSFSTTLDDWPVTNQKKSGRCWMFAALNLLRANTLKKLGLKSFEFSQNYTLFWDKFERANFFLEEIITTAERPIDDRLIHFMLAEPLSDGGQWNMAVNIIRKHGLVPKTAMPETESSSNTRRMNTNLKHLLRQGAFALRTSRAQGAGLDEVRAQKHTVLADVWRVLCIHLGTPPAQFDWQWTTTNGEFRRDGLVTPREFFARYVDLDIDNYVCLVHDPRDGHPFGRTYTVDFLGNTVGGDPVVYLNVDMKVMKQLALSQIEAGSPVWFGCDVGPHMRRDLGLWDAQLFDYENLYDVSFHLTKAQRLMYGQTQMTHAMLFTGVDTVEGVPRRWKVENSWGESGGQKGFYLMNDNWFDHYVFEIAVPRTALTDDLARALEVPPTVLPAWDPMGALARS
ncbi:MAG: C1 family peptidase [Myxococcota bacterium]|nr:C1 family peptidase [Myxococcota bacterium]